MESTPHRRGAEVARALADLTVEVEAAWSRTCARWAVEPGGPQEHDLARLVAEGPDQFDWRVVDAALERLACPECGRALGSGARGCGPCDEADGYRYAARESDRPGAAPGHEHALRVAWSVSRHPHRHAPRAVCGFELALAEIHADRLPTTARAQSYRAMIDRLTDAEVERVASLAELAALAGRRTG
ncbi:hypothetical protein [Nocardiopsis sp. NRRL B-16309]|uniref:hypothetical protein n=1 Tax=Nocardiopsis sp. NRRL B-16309 TaxID=1519494 RepID=UPI0006AEC3BC|nr:hypothetical protein [Nocardiopsis sp. NRRL B-16309]KOX15885.1 hypothetical protein ADL05_13700 [Nocardiopsis sp. NRRL B-16309]